MTNVICSITLLIIMLGVYTPTTAQAALDVAIYIVGTMVLAVVIAVAALPNASRKLNTPKRR